MQAWVWLLLAVASGSKLALRRLDEHSHSARQVQASGGTDVYFVVELLDRFRRGSTRNAQLAEQRLQFEQQGLEAAIEHDADTDDRRALAMALQYSQESSLEVQNAGNEMVNFVNTLKHILGSSAVSADNCAQLTCGRHAQCEEMKRPGDGGYSLVQCECEPGYEGDGYVCNPISQFAMYPLIDLPKEETPMQVTDIDVQKFAQNKVIVVFRQQPSNEGFYVMGEATPTDMVWSKPVSFTNGGEAWSPKAMGFGNGRVAIAYRNKKDKGTGFVVGGLYNAPDAERKGGSLNLTAPAEFAKGLSHRTSMVAVEGMSIVLCYVGQGANGNDFGAALVYKVLPDGKLLKRSKAPIRFSERPVTHLTTTALDNKLFVVGFRGAPLKSSDGQEVKEEAAMVVGAYAPSLGTVVFEPTEFSVEPSQPQIWSRGVSVVGQNLVMYAYQEGVTGMTKSAVLRVDPDTKRITFQERPKVVHQGETPYVNAISLAAYPMQPQTVVYYETKGIGKAHICDLSAAGTTQNCKDISIVGRPLLDIKGLALGMSRVLFVMSDSKGVPYFEEVFTNEEMPR